MVISNESIILKALGNDVQICRRPPGANRLLRLTVNRPQERAAITFRKVRKSLNSAKRALRKLPTVYSDCC